MSVDREALERLASPVIQLAPMAVLKTAGSSDPVQCLSSSFARVYASVAVAELKKSIRDGQVTITIEGSDDGDSWEAVDGGELTFTSDGVQYVTIDTPPAFTRIRWALTGMRSFRLLGASVVPGSLDKPGESGSLPAGGTTGQVLTKASNTDGDADWEDPEGGGSQSVRAARFPFTFDSANLLTGALAATLADGEMLVLSRGADGQPLVVPMIFVSTAWNGTTPVARLYVDNRIDPPYAWGSPADVTNPDTGIINDGSGHPDAYQSNNEVVAIGGGIGSLIARGGPIDIRVGVDDGAGGDPGATQGQAELILMITAAA